MKTFFETIFGNSSQPEKADKLYFVITRNITKKEDTEAGLIVDIELAEGVKFLPIALSKKPEITSRHKGLAKVEQELELHFSNPGVVFSQLSKAKEAGLKISILHTNEKGFSFLYGENIGLSIAEITKEFVNLNGEEADTFYKVDAQLAEKLTK